MVEIASDRPLFKTIMVEMAYSVIHLHNRVNKNRIVVLLLCPKELELGKHLRCLLRCDHWKLLVVVVIVIVCGQRRWLEYINRGQCAGTPSDGCELVWGTSPLLVAGEEKKRVMPCFYAQAV
jgi:hypothetical protein